jgi:nucleotide-binding universal stress UspA family protein
VSVHKLTKQDEKPPRRQTMYAHVIVGVDGKPGGRDASALASILAAAGAVVSLVHVSTTGPDAGVEAQFADEDILAGALAQELDLCGTDAQVERVPALSVAAGLKQAAQQHDADLIVLGAAHRHGLSRVLSHDHVTSVIHHTPCAVAVAPAGFAQNPGILARIGVAYDASPESEVALAHAGLLEAQRHSNLVLRHVVEPHFYASGWGTVAVPVDDPIIELQAARERLGNPDGLVLEHVCGTARDVLLDFSRSVDLLVCGSRRNSAVRRVALGSNSDHLARHIKTPLLIPPAVDTIAVERWRTQRLLTTA